MVVYVVYLYKRRQVSDSEKRYLAGNSGNANSYMLAQRVLNLREAFGTKPCVRVVPYSSEASSASQHNTI